MRPYPSIELHDVPFSAAFRRLPVSMKPEGFSVLQRGTYMFFLRSAKRTKKQTKGCDPLDSRGRFKSSAKPNFDENIGIELFHCLAET